MSNSNSGHAPCRRRGKALLVLFATIAAFSGGAQALFPAPAAASMDVGGGECGWWEFCNESGGGGGGGGGGGYGGYGSGDSGGSYGGDGSVGSDGSDQGSGDVGDGSGSADSEGEVVVLNDTKPVDPLDGNQEQDEPALQSKSPVAAWLVDGNGKVGHTGHFRRLARSGLLNKAAHRIREMIGNDVGEGDGDHKLQNHRDIWDCSRCVGIWRFDF